MIMHYFHVNSVSSGKEINVNINQNERDVSRWNINKKTSVKWYWYLFFKMAEKIN